MAPQIISQMREHIVFWHYDQQKKVPEIAVLADRSESAIYEIL
jgi:hypothetical protein